MANYKLILPSVAKFEGGLSSDPKDSCSKLRSDVIDPKNGLGYHTNKGVCYSTWVSASKKLGFNSSGKAFVNMTQAQWEAIIKSLYWNPLNLDSVNSQAIAEILFQSNWGSGMGGAMVLVRFLQDKINVPQTGKMGTDTIARLNQITSNKVVEKNLFNDIWNRRLSYLKSLKSFATYGKGWTNRMNDLLARGYSYIDANKTPLGIGALLMLVGGAYLLNKNF